MNKHLLMLAIASACLFTTQAGAQSQPMQRPTQAGAQSQDEHKVAREKIDATYKMDKAKCDGLKDNAKDVCEKEAKGKQNVAKAELEQQIKPSESNARKVEEEKVKAAYEVAKEKCDDQKGEAKSACEKQAKADETKAKADIRAMMKPAAKTQ
jgi:hypothetical protein